MRAIVAGGDKVRHRQASNRPASIAYARPGDRMQQQPIFFHAAKCRRRTNTDSQINFDKQTRHNLLRHNLNGK
jgi:hypothetical protein